MGITKGFNYDAAIWKITCHGYEYAFLIEYNFESGDDYHGSYFILCMMASLIGRVVHFNHLLFRKEKKTFK